MTSSMSSTLLAWLLQMGGALPSPTVGPPAVQALVFSDQAVRLLALQARSFQTEFLGCMIGEIRDGVVRVDRIAPATASLLFQAITPIIPSPITPVTSSPIAAQPPSAVAER